MKTVIVICTFVLILGLVYFRNQTTNQSSLTRSHVLSAIDEPSPTTPPPPPTPFPFQEMTIPSLKNRPYQSQLGTKELVTENNSYTSYLTSYDSDGLKINGQLTIPKSLPPQDGFPAVVFVHGYIPPQNYTTLGNYSAFVDYLASQGLVVFKIDLRGHADSEGEASGAYYSEDYVVDTLNAYEALQKEVNINPNRIGLWGHSMAGNVVFRAMAAKTDIPKVVIWAGAVYTYQDFSDYQIQDNSYQPPPEESERQRKRDELFNTHGRFDPASKFWQQVPATNYLEGISGSLQIHHAVDDNVVDIGYSHNLMDILDDTNIPHQLFEYQSGGHNMTGSTFTQAMSHTAEFLTNY